MDCEECEIKKDRDLYRRLFAAACEDIGRMTVAIREAAEELERGDTEGTHPENKLG